MTEGNLRTIHVFPSQDSYETNQGSIGADDLALIPIEIATQEEAETGTDNTKHMTPLRVKQAIATRVTVVESYVSGTSWYRVWSDGWVEQGGRGPMGSLANTTLTFLKPFRDTNYTVVGTYYKTSGNPTSSGSDNNETVVIKSTTKMEVRRDGDYGFSWYTCGKGA